MTRQSFSLTKPNDDWLNAMVERQEYANKTELVNDLIRRARREQGSLDALRLKLDRAEASGFAETSETELLDTFKSRARHDGDL